MTRSQCFAAGGIGFTLSAPEPLATVLFDSLADMRVESVPRRSPALTVSANADDTFDLHRGKVPAGSALPADQALHAALSMVNETVASHWSKANAALHASVLDRGGAGVALIGYSGFGKTTLAAAATRSGWGFVSDELGLVDEHHVAHAFHRPLGLRRGGMLHLGLERTNDPLFDVVRPWRASTLGSLAQRTRLCCLVFMAAPTADNAVTPMSPAFALANMLSNLHGAAGVEHQVFRRLERLVRAVPAVRLPRHELSAMVPLLDDILVSGHAVVAASPT